MTLIDTAAAALILRITPRQTRNLVAQCKLTNRGTARRFGFDVNEVDRLAIERFHERFEQELRTRVKRHADNSG
jgi:hypothetical protein